MVFSCAAPEQNVLRSWGGSSPVYENGLLNIGHHSGDLEGRDGAPAKASDVCYRLYVNGEKVKEEEKSVKQE